jgi:hypothetical protein
MAIRIGDIIALGVLVALVGYFVYSYRRDYAKFSKIIGSNNRSPTEVSETASGIAVETTKNNVIFFGVPVLLALAAYLAFSRGYTKTGWVLGGLSGAYALAVFAMIAMLVLAFNRGFNRRA